MSQPALTPDFVDTLAAALAGARVSSCLQCRKCSNGCPVAARVDIRPHELVRLIQLGQRDEVLSCRMIWECTSCHTCITRCPQKVDIAALIDQLRPISQSAGKVPASTRVPVFNDLFLKAIQKRGRVFEPALMAFYKLRTRRFFEDMGKLPMMLAKRKLPFLPTSVPGSAQRRDMFKRAARAAAQKREGHHP